MVRTVSLLESQEVFRLEVRQSSLVSVNCYCFKKKKKRKSPELAQITMKVTILNHRDIRFTKWVQEFFSTISLTPSLQPL